MGKARLHDVLKETGAFSDLSEPTILASGEVGIYYINTEKVLGDGGEWERFGSSASGMRDHVLEVQESNKDFDTVIGALANAAMDVMSPDCNYVISGGQRRDWLFSFPVAQTLGLQHVAIYKGGKVEIFNPKGHPPILPRENTFGIHIVDLITAGSSLYRVEDKEVGWIPSMNELGFPVKGVLAVVDRLQGGRALVEGMRASLTSLVEIDEDFLRAQSDFPDRAAVYLRGPAQFARNYFHDHGINFAVSFFDPSGGKLDRAERFVRRYGADLINSGRLDQLQEKVERAYGLDITKFLEG